MAHVKYIEKNNFKVLMVYPNLPLMLVPSIAIGLFTRILKDQGYQVQMFETTHYDTEENNYSEMKINYSEYRVNLLNARSLNVKDDLGIEIKSNMLSDFREEVNSFQPDAMIFTIVEDTYRQALSMLDLVKDMCIPSFVGGVFPTMAPEIVINSRNINFIGIGEGEKSIVDFSEAVRQHKPLAGIPGSWFRREDGAIIKTPQQSLGQVGDIVPDFSLFSESRFNRPMGGRVYRMVAVESYRGCPYACTFCNSPTQLVLAKKAGIGSHPRRAAINSLRDYLSELRGNYNPEYFFFIDDSFLARPRQEIFDFCDMYEEFNLPFYIQTRTETFTPEVLARLKEVGCHRIAIGIESGNEQYREKILRRPISNAEIIHRFEMVADSKIAFSINLIIGMPGETRELVMDTVELARSIRGFDAITSFIFTPYHGTPLRTTAIDNGWLDPKEITIHNTSRSILNMPPPYLSADEISGLLMVLPLYIYFPKSEWKNIRRAEISDDEGLKIRKHYSEIYSEKFLGESQTSPKEFMPNDERRTGKGLINPFIKSPLRLSAQQIDSLASPMTGL